MVTSFHENLKEAMNIKQITTKELAVKTGIKEGTISSYLKTNGAIPNIINGWKLANALGISVKFLVTGFEENCDDKSINSLSIYSKYSKTIHDLDSIPEEARKPIESMISEMKTSYINKR